MWGINDTSNENEKETQIIICENEVPAARTGLQAIKVIVNLYISDLFADTGVACEGITYVPIVSMYMQSGGVPVTDVLNIVNTEIGVEDAIHPG